MEIAQAPNLLVAFGIGSCLVISLYDPILKRGALAHAMLPKFTNNQTCENPFKYADLAIDEMIKRMKFCGSNKRRLEAKIVGGANMFQDIDTVDIGMENIQYVKKKLEMEGIPVVGESVGGGIGRSVEFDTRTGTVRVRVQI